MPTMFAYSWITSLLAGNPNIVRISERTNEITEAALSGIESILRRPEFQEICEQNAFITFPRGDKLLEDISKAAKARVIWGGDETVSNICSIPKADDCIDITFPDKYSIALFKESDFEDLDDKELKRLAHLFYNDTYGADQNACSSPRTVFWLHDSKTADMGIIRDKWWNAVAEESAVYDLQPWKATEKYRMLCRTYAVNEGLGPVRKWSNRLYVVPSGQYKGSLINLEARFGLFYEKEISSLDELMPFMEDKIQTIVCSGSDQAELYEKIRFAGCDGVDRVTAIGEALDFNTVWDRKDLVENDLGREYTYEQIWDWGDSLTEDCRGVTVLECSNDPESLARYLALLRKGCPVILIGKDLDEDATAALSFVSSQSMSLRFRSPRLANVFSGSPYVKPSVFSSAAISAILYRSTVIWDGLRSLFSPTASTVISHSFSESKLSA